MGLTDKIEKHIHNKVGNNPKNRRSRAMYYAFSPVRMFLICLGRLPMQVYLKADGTFAYRYLRTHVHVTVFFFTSTISIILFVMMTLGAITMYFGFPEPRVFNKCGYTWEWEQVYHQLVPIAVVYTQLLLNCIASVFIFMKGEDYVHYFNYWNRALEMMDMDISHGPLYTGLKEMLELVIVVLALIVLYWFNIPSLHDTCGLLSSLLTRLFVTDIYKFKADHQVAVLADDYFTEILPTCGNLSRTKNYFTHPPKAYVIAKALGFVVLLYSMYSSRSFILQFKFFCQLLGNCAQIWNERLKNCLHGVRSKQDDQFRRRLTVSNLLKDHLIIVQLFRLSEITYYFILFSYFPILSINLILQGAYIPVLISQEYCTGLWYRQYLKAEKQDNTTCTNYEDILKYGKDRVAFRDPCKDERYDKMMDVIVALVFLGQNLRLMYQITFAGAFAHQQAMQGWSIMRRHMFMWTTNKEQRNFVYSMINSLSAHNNPIWITVSGYYSLNPVYFLELLGMIIGYVIPAIQFKLFTYPLPTETLCKTPA